MTHRFTRVAKTFAVGVTALACSGAAASDTVTGSFTASKNDRAGTYTCLGTPDCSGVAYVTVKKDNGCSNAFSFASAVSFTNFDLSHAGPFSGSFTSAQAQEGHTQNADGTCNYLLLPGRTWPYDGSWDGQNGKLTIHAVDGSGQPDDFSGAFSAQLVDIAPVFPMTVTGSITPANTDAEATIHPRPQEAGTQQNIYVFTHAPSSLVGEASAKAESGSPHLPAASDDAVVCVLAQVTADGHLIAASAGALQAALSGVPLTSAGQAVQLLDNVPTPNVAGATVFVGYGTSSGAMLASGVYQAAVSVPGAQQCTASLAAAPAPASPGVLSGLWWNAAESGWGIHFTQRGKNLFAAWYTYDTSGNPKWYVAPNCGFANANAFSGSCTSPLYEVDGPTFFGATFHAPTPGQVKNAGTLQLDFQGPNTASLTYTLGTFTRTVPIVRQVFPVAQSPTPAVDYTDLWWNPSESGWGMAITQQFGNIFLAWYVYDANGKPFWYVAPACTVEGSGCSGTLYRTTGPAFGPPLDPTKVQAIAVGTAAVSFIDANNGVLSFTVDGVAGTKPITRQLF